MKEKNYKKLEMEYMNNWMDLTKWKLFVSIKNPRWPTPQDKFNIEPCEEMKEFFFYKKLEIEYTNNNWMDLTKWKLFVSIKNPKMANTTGQI